MATNGKPPDFSEFGDFRDEIVRRCDETGVGYQIVKMDDYVLAVDFREGSDDGYIRISADVARALEPHMFEGWEIVGDYLGIYDRATGVAELLVAHTAGSGSLLSIRQFVGFLGGIEESGSYSTVVSSIEKREFDSANAAKVDSERDAWRLPFNPAPRQTYSVELNSTSARALLVASTAIGAAAFERHKSGSLTALQISQLETPAEGPIQQEFIEQVENIAWKALFEFGVSHGLPLELQHRPRFRPITGIPGPLRQPKLTENVYRRDAMALYLYAQSTGSMPVFQYLAYYRVLESYFTDIVNAKSIRVLVDRLADPRFSASSMTDLADLAGTIHLNSPASFSDEQQLALLIQDLPDTSRLAALINDPARRAFFAQSDKLGGDTPVIRLGNDNQDIEKQVAKRVVSVRNRIAHAKAGRSESWRRILPFTPAADAELQNDISLVQFLAEAVLIQRSSPAK